MNWLSQIPILLTFDCTCVPKTPITRTLVQFWKTFSDRFSFGLPCSIDSIHSLLQKTDEISGYLRIVTPTQSMERSDMDFTNFAWVFTWYYIGKQFIHLNSKQAMICTDKTRSVAWAPNQYCPILTEFWQDFTNVHLVNPEEASTCIL